MGWIDINEIIRELLAVKASNEDLTRRVERLEQALYSGDTNEQVRREAGSE